MELGTNHLGRHAGVVTLAQTLADTATLATYCG